MGEASKHRTPRCPTGAQVTEAARCRPDKFQGLLREKSLTALAFLFIFIQYYFIFLRQGHTM